MRKLSAMVVLSWLLSIIAPFPATPALSAVTEATRMHYCMVLLTIISAEAVEEQKAGVDIALASLDKAARAEWFKEYPFLSYDAWTRKVRADFKGIGIVEAAAIYPSYCEGELPWEN